MSALLGRSTVSRLTVSSVSFALLLLLVSCGGSGGSGSSGPAKLQSVSVTPANPSIAVGATQQFKATGNYSDGSSKDLTSSATWNSKTTSVATVDSSGLATAVAAGSSVIRASSGGFSGSTTLTVTPPAVSFKAGQTLASGGPMPIGLVVADFNGDGKPDIAVSDETNNTISVFLNDGTGHFGTPVVTNVTISAVNLGAMVTGDFNEDGKADLAVATIAGSQQTIVLLGNGDGTFQQQPAIANSFGFLSAQVADLNSDGHQDLIMGLDGSLAVSLGAGNGTFNGTTFLTGSSFPGIFLGVAVADFNGDGKLDLAAVDAGNGSSNTGSLNFYPGNGDGSFGTPTSTSTFQSGPLSLSYGDFNNEGKLDLLVGFPSNAAVTFGDGTGGFDFQNVIGVYVSGSTSPNGVRVLATDLTGNGKVDAVTTDYASGEVQVALNSALQTNAPAGGVFSFSLSPGTTAMAVGDLDGDGTKDVVVINQTTGQVSTILSK